jgi:hypothetical protein
MERTMAQKPPTQPRNDQGIGRDQRGQEQPKDKERAQQTSGCKWCAPSSLPTTATIAALPWTARDRAHRSRRETHPSAPARASQAWAEHCGCLGPDMGDGAVDQLVGFAIARTQKETSAAAITTFSRLAANGQAPAALDTDAQSQPERS